MQENLFFGIKKTATGFNAVELSKEEFRKENRSEYPLTLDYGAHVSLNWSDDGKKFNRGQIVFYKGNTMEEWDGIMNGWAMDVVCNCGCDYYHVKYYVSVKFADNQGRTVKKYFEECRGDIGELFKEIFSYLFDISSYINLSHKELLDSLDKEWFIEHSGEYDECIEMYAKHSRDAEKFIADHNEQLTDQMIHTIKEKLADIKEVIVENYPDNQVK